MDLPELARLKQVQVRAESIDAAAPDLLARAVPPLEQWSRDFHAEHDKRYEWSPPPGVEQAFGHDRVLSPRERLLWALEDNIHTPLDFSVTASDDERAPRTPTFGAPGKAPAGAAATILTQFVDEPDAQLDNNLNAEPYLARLRDRMGLFYEGTAHTHTFRHYFVPDSWIPPLLTPRGEAPYQSALYARLAIEAFRTGHRYWGYRFLAWSIHYAQDVTQPWHTVFLPSLAMLSFSRARMRHAVASYHYLTEAFADSWILRARARAPARPALERVPAAREDLASPFVVAEWVEAAARRAHDQAASVASSVESLFAPLVALLDDSLKPRLPQLRLGGLTFALGGFDLSGNGAAATATLAPLWQPGFTRASERDALASEVSTAISSAVDVSRRIVGYVLGESGELTRLFSKAARPRPDEALAPRACVASGPPWDGAFWPRPQREPSSRAPAPRG